MRETPPPGHVSAAWPVGAQTLPSSSPRKATVTAGQRPARLLARVQQMALAVRKAKARAPRAPEPVGCCRQKLLVWAALPSPPPVWASGSE